MRFEIFKTKEWRFRIVARNGKILAQSEGYKRKQDCRKTVDRIAKESPDAEVRVVQ